MKAQNKLIFLLLMLPLSFVYAEPSKKETANFIIEKTKVTGGHNERCNNNTWRFRVSFSNDYCTMNTAFYHFNGFFIKDSCNLSQNLHTGTFRTINLIDIDPDFIDTRYAKEGRILVSTRERKDKITVKEKDYKTGEIKTYNLDVTNVYTYNYKRNASKLEKAIRHLVKLCGGTGELF